MVSVCEGMGMGGAGVWGHGCGIWVWEHGYRWGGCVDRGMDGTSEWRDECGGGVCGCIELGRVCGGMSMARR